MSSSTYNNSCHKGNCFRKNLKVKIVDLLMAYINKHIIVSTFNREKHIETIEREGETKVKET